MILILLFLILVYGGPFALGYLFFRIQHTGENTAPAAANSHAWRSTLKLLCAATLLLAYVLGHFQVLSYPGAIMLSMVLGGPVFFLSAQEVIKIKAAPASEGEC